MSQVAAVTGVLQAVLGVDDQARRRAEQQFHAMKSAADGLITALLQIGVTNEQHGMRNLAFVLARQVAFTKDAKWFVVPVERRTALKRALLPRAVAEPNSAARKAIILFVADVGCAELEDGLWPELMPWLGERCRSSTPLERVVAFKVLTNMAGYLETMEPAALHPVVQVMHASVVDATQQSKVRTSAFKALSTLLIVMEEGSSKLRPFVPLVKDLVTTTKDLTATCAAAPGSDEAEQPAIASWSYLIDVAEHQPSAYRQALPALVQTASATARAQSVSEKVRRLALEALATIATSAPSLCRKMPSNGFLTASLVPVMLMLQEAGGDAGWGEREESEESDLVTNCIVAQSILNRFGTALGGERVWSVCKPLISRMVAAAQAPASPAGSPTRAAPGSPAPGSPAAAAAGGGGGAAGSPQPWQAGVAAVGAISSLAESLPDHWTTADLTPVARLIVQFANYQHPFVQYTAAQALGYMCNFQGPLFQRSLPNELLGAVVQWLRSPHKRVSVIGLRVLVNFLATVPSALVRPHCQAMLSELFRLLPSPSRSVREWSLTALSTLVETAPDAFPAFYGRLITPILAIVEDRGGREERLVRAKAVECATILIHAVGKGTAAAELPKLVQLMLHLLSEKLSADDPLRAYLMMGFARLVQAMGAEFKPLMGNFAQLLTSVAAAQVDTRLLTAEERQRIEQAEAEDDSLEESEFGLIHSDVAGGTLHVKTSQLEEKTEAVRLLSQLCSDAEPELLGPHIPAIAGAFRAVLPLPVAIYDDARTVAADGMVALVEAGAKLAYKQHRGDAAAAGAAIRPQLVAVLRQFCQVIARDAASNDCSAESLNLLIRAAQRVLHEACIVRGSDGRPLMPQPAAQASGGGWSPPTVFVGRAGERSARSHAQLLQDAEMRGVIGALVDTITKSMQRTTVTQQETRVRADEFDEEELESRRGLLREEEMMQSAAMDTIGALVRSHGAVGVAAVDKYAMPFVRERLAIQGAEAQQRLLALSLTVDILEGGEAESLRRAPALVPLLVASCKDSNMAALQSASYGLGAAAKSMGILFAAHAGKAVAALLDLLRRLHEPSAARQHDVADALDNAASALGRIIHFTIAPLAPGGGAAPRPTVPALPQPAEALMSHWLSLLPLKEDGTESRQAAVMVCQRLEAADPLLAGGADWPNLPRIFECLAFVVSDPEIKRSFVTDRIRQALQRARTSLPSSALAAAMGKVSGETQATLRGLFGAAQ